jgi:hypothetical protein
MYCTNKDEVKQSIRQNQMAHGPRGIGKTQGILEVIHEDHQGAAVLMVPFSALKSIARQRYKEAFPHDVVPIICTLCGLRSAIAGTNIPVYVDTLDLVDAFDRERVHELLCGRVIGAW